MHQSVFKVESAALKSQHLIVSGVIESQDSLLNYSIALAVSCALLQSGADASQTFSFIVINQQTLSPSTLSIMRVVLSILTICVAVSLFGWGHPTFFRGPKGMRKQRQVGIRESQER